MSKVTIQKLIHIGVYLIMAAVLLPLACLVYWIAGGEFTRGSGMAALVMFCLYLLHVLYEVALDSYRKAEGSAILTDLYRKTVAEVKVGK